MLLAVSAEGRGISINWEMLNRVDYSRPHVIKNALRSYNELMMLARKGDQVAHIICIDIKTAIHAPGVLSFKQRRYLGLWWQGFPMIDIAARHRVSQQAAHEVINFGNSSNGGTGIGVGCFLFNGDNRTESRNFVNVGAFHVTQKASGVSRESFHVTTLTFSIDGIKCQ